MLYHTGFVFNRTNKDKAMKWLYLGIALENRTCETMLACILLKQDEPTAIKLFQSAAKKNHKGAIVNLAQIYQSESQRNYPESFRLLSLPEVKNSSDAQRMLAVMYMEGLHVDRDEKKAFGLYKSSAELGNSYGQYYVAMCYKHGHGTPINIAESLRWLRVSAEDGNHRAQNDLGGHYKKSADYPEAFKWFNLSAPHGNKAAMMNLGICYFNGYGVKADPIKAKELFQKSFDKGYLRAESFLGMMHFFGHGCKKDYGKALEIFSSAAERKCSRGMEGLGTIYYFGHGVKQDFKEAAKWFLAAFESNNFCGYTPYILGMMHLHGHGLMKDEPQALKMFSIAHSMGEKSAEQYLVVAQPGEKIENTSAKINLIEDS